MKDLYQVLGVGESDSPEEIKRAYRRLAKQFHPDVTGGDKAKETRFKEVSQAYEVLGDEKRRAEYDAQRKNPFSGFGGGGAGGPFSGGSGRVHVDFEDLFGKRGAAGSPFGGLGDMFTDLFSGGGPRPSPRGADVSATIELDLATAALGGEQNLVVDGKRLTVKIPPGVDEGQTIRVAGKGGPGKGGSGDLLLTVHLRPHPHVRRQGADLEVDLPVTIEQAVLGDKVEVQTLEGTVKVNLAAGTSSGTKLRLRGKGAVRRGAAGSAERGDLFAVVQIVVPKDLPPKAKELIAEFARLTKR